MGHVQKDRGRLGRADLVRHRRARERLGGPLSRASRALHRADRGGQGDEPGGFNAASLIVTHYDILSGNVWVVPNLNFLSIIKRSRGVYGDLNRKFDKLPIKDPEYQTINRIKKLIVDPKVDLILNLHDGSGFYRDKYYDRLYNQNRWGQCIIIDQDQTDSKNFGNLLGLAQTSIAHVNKHLLKNMVQGPWSIIMA